MSKEKETPPNPAKDVTVPALPTKHTRDDGGSSKPSGSPRPPIERRGR